MTSARAALFVGAGEPFQMREYEVPEPAPGDMIVRLSYTSVCGSDVHFWKGEDPLVEQVARSGGLILGHETVGRVAALGAGVTTDSAGTALSEGDAVVFSYFAPDWSCAACRREQANACQDAMLSVMRLPHEAPHLVGAFAEYLYVAQRQYVVRLPDGMEPADAITANCAAAQSVFALQHAGFSEGERLVVQGAGGLGLLAVAAAKRLGAGRIVAIDAVPDRLAAAARLGADTVIDVSQTDKAERQDAVRRELDGGADVVLELAGVNGAIAEGLRMLDRGGRYVEMGQVMRGAERLDVPANALIARNTTVTGLALYDPRVLPQAVDLLASLRDEPTVQHLLRGRTYTLDRLEDAMHDAAGVRDAVRPVVDLEGTPA